MAILEPCAVVAMRAAAHERRRSVTHASSLRFAATHVGRLLHSLSGAHKVRPSRMPTEIGSHVLCPQIDRVALLVREENVVKTVRVEIDEAQPIVFAALVDDPNTVRKRKLR